MCNNTITKDPTTPQCVATLPCEMSSVFKAMKRCHFWVTLYTQQLSCAKQVSDFVLLRLTVSVVRAVSEIDAIFGVTVNIELIKYW